MPLAQQRDDALGRVRCAGHARVDAQLGLLRRFAGRIDAGEIGELAAPGLAVQPLGVAQFGIRQRRVDEYLDEFTGLQQGAPGLALVAKRRDERGEHDRAGVYLQVRDRRRLRASPGHRPQRLRGDRASMRRARPTDVGASRRMRTPPTAAALRRIRFHHACPDGRRRSARIPIRDRGKSETCGSPTLLKSPSRFPTAMGAAAPTASGAASRLAPARTRAAGRSAQVWSRARARASEHGRRGPPVPGRHCAPVRRD